MVFLNGYADGLTDHGFCAGRACRFSTVGKWLLQANIITRVSAFFVTNPVVLWFCAGVCKGQLNLIRKEDNIYK
jgi:hypothetical protein